MLNAAHRYLRDPLSRLDWINSHYIIFHLGNIPWRPLPGVLLLEWHCHDDRYRAWGNMVISFCNIPGLHTIHVPIHRQFAQASSQ